MRQWLNLNERRLYWERGGVTRSVLSRDVLVGIQGCPYCGYGLYTVIATFRWCQWCGAPYRHVDDAVIQELAAHSDWKETPWGAVPPAEVDHGYTTSSPRIFTPVGIFSALLLGICTVCSLYAFSYGALFLAALCTSVAVVSMIFLLSTIVRSVRARDHSPQQRISELEAANVAWDALLERQKDSGE